MADKIFSQRRFKWKFRIGLKRCLFFCQGTISFLVHSQADAQRDIVNWNLKLPILLRNVNFFCNRQKCCFLSTIHIFLQLPLSGLSLQRIRVDSFMSLFGCFLRLSFSPCLSSCFLIQFFILFLATKKEILLKKIQKNLQKNSGGVSQRLLKEFLKIHKSLRRQASRRLSFVSSLSPYFPPNAS